MFFAVKLDEGIFENFDTDFRTHVMEIEKN